MSDPVSPLRILVVSALWQGANDYSFVRAFRRAGHSVRVVSDEWYSGGRWQDVRLKTFRRLAQGLIAEDFSNALLKQAQLFRPDLLFVFKGPYIKPGTLEQIRDLGIVTIQFYPDTGYRVHSKYMAQSITAYDWVFTTKPHAVSDLKDNYGFANVSFEPHAYDPEFHCPWSLSDRDRSDYASDVTFIGNHSAGKQKNLVAFLDAVGPIKAKVWGHGVWKGKLGAHEAVYQGGGVFGVEYAKALQASAINVALLFEGSSDAPAPDVITARTFEIPATGGFMIHQRTDEAMAFFEDGRECAFFDDPADLAEKVRYYLANPEERAAVAARGRERCLSSGYSVDDRVRTVSAKYHELRKG